MSGLNLGPMMMSFGGAGGLMVDFTRSSERALLKRSDVRSELFIDSKQREQLADMEAAGAQQLQTKVLQAVVQNIGKNSDLKALSQQNPGGPPDLGALKDTLNASFQAMQDSLQAFQVEQDSKGEALLYPKQIKRLRELDLQWRGLLSLSDKSVADLLMISPEQKSVVDGALKDYQTTQMNLLQPIMTQAMQVGQQAATSGRGPRGFDPQLMQKTLSDAVESEAIKKARTAAEDKVRASLTADQKAQWKKMIGERFIFRHLEQ